MCVCVPSFSRGEFNPWFFKLQLLIGPRYVFHATKSPKPIFSGSKPLSLSLCGTIRDSFPRSKRRHCPPKTQILLVQSAPCFSLVRESPGSSGSCKSQRPSLLTSCRGLLPTEVPICEAGKCFGTRIGAGKSTHIGSWWRMHQTSDDLSYLESVPTWQKQTPRGRINRIQIRKDWLNHDALDDTIFWIAWES